MASPRVSPVMNPLMRTMSPGNLQVVLLLSDQSSRHAGCCLPQISFHIGPCTLGRHYCINIPDRQLWISLSFHKSLYISVSLHISVLSFFNTTRPLKRKEKKCTFDQQSWFNRLPCCIMHMMSHTLRNCHMPSPRGENKVTHWLTYLLWHKLSCNYSLWHAITFKWKCLWSSAVKCITVLRISQFFQKKTVDH